MNSVVAAGTLRGPMRPKPTLTYSPFRKHQPYPVRSGEK